MNRWHLSRLCAVIGLGVLLLAGCGTDPVSPDQDVSLQPGYGVAAVVFDNLDVLTAVTIKSPDPKGGEVDISYVGKGVTMFVYTLPAGSYCLTHFNTAFYRFTQDDMTHGICFDVVAGKVAYSGNLAPRAVGRDTKTFQNYYWAAFEKSFKDQYPKLANLPIVKP